MASFRQPAAPWQPRMAAAPTPMQPVPFPSPAADRQTVVWILGFYLLSGILADILQMSLGITPFLSTVTGLIVFFSFLTSGRMLRALDAVTGKLWLFFMIWLIVDVPFSYWPGGSKDVLVQYLPKTHMVFFFICAAAVSVKACRTLLTTSAIGGLLLVLECMKYGAADEGGRFCIPASMFLGNPNDLGIQLVVAMGPLVFLLLNKSVLSRVIGIAGMMLAFYYMLKTGSRGSLVACSAMGLFCLLFTRYRMKVALLAVPMALIIVALPGDTLHRLTLILLHPVQSDAGASLRDQASIESQIERQELLAASIDYMFSHPLFGVGPGQFSDYRWSTMKMAGEHVASLGTHNSYTQIGSEAGFPAFFCFAGVVILSIRSNYRIFRRADRDEKLKDVAQISFCLLLACIGYGVNALFHHSAYSLPLATMGGTSCALYLASKPLLTAK